MRKKRDVESLNRAIDRLISEDDGTHTGRAILGGIAGIQELSYEDARVMLAIVTEDRESETRDPFDLR